MQRITTVSCALVVAFAGGCQGLDFNESGSELRLSGAIFTTLSDGSAVNHNIYDDKDDVYLDGGPGNGAPQHAAGLPDGDYYFQVTDPSGKTLLSTDAITARRVTLDEGIIIAAFNHDTGIDADHGALTVQLMPYLDTPNPGGEYKVWLTPVANYTGEDGHGAKHGFVPRYSKTDNYKVREIVVVEPYCGDGHVDAGEACDDGNAVNGDGCENDCTVTPPPPCCGDGNVDAGEECDDGNTTSGDGCSATCTIETPPPPPPCCGDGNVDAGEECDDGNTTSGDGCSATCTLEPVCDPV